MDDARLLEVKRDIGTSDWPQSARVLATDLVIEIERLRRDLLGIYRVAALHFMGGAFDPGHMRDIAHMAAAARGELGESSPDEPYEHDPDDPDDYDEAAENLPPHLRAQQQLSMPLTPLQVNIIEAYPERVMREIERILGGRADD